MKFTLNNNLSIESLFVHQNLKYKVNGSM